MIQKARATTLHLSLERLHNQPLLICVYPPLERRDLEAYASRIEHMNSEFPLQELDKDESQGLAKEYEKLLKESRQLCGTKRYVHWVEAAETDDSDADEGRPPVSDPVEDISSALDPSHGSHAQESEETTTTPKKSKSEDVKPEASWDPDLIYFLPVASTQAKVLTHLNLAFRKEAKHFVLTEGLSKSQLSVMMRIKQKLGTLQELRGITCDSLARPSIEPF